MILATGYAPAILSAIDEAEEKARCEGSLAEFVKRAWQEIEPESSKLVWNWHLDVICAYMEGVADGRIKRLIINISPGTMKSLVVMVFYPAWTWAKRPGERFLCGTNDGTLATRDAVRMRQLVTSDWYQKHWGSKVELSSDQAEKGMFANTARGHRQSQSILAKVTGKRGSCIAGHVLIETEIGPVRMEALCYMASPPKVWSFNHATNALELRRVIASRQLLAPKTIDVCTFAGNIVTCTPDHLIFDGSDYAKAESISGRRLSILRWANRPAQWQSNTLQCLLKGQIGLHNLWRRVSAGWSGGRQACAQRAEGWSVLHQGVQQACKESAADHQVLRALREAVSTALSKPGKEVLQQGVHDVSSLANQGAATKAMRPLWRDDGREQRQAGVLQHDMQEPCALNPHDGCWEFALHSGVQPGWSFPQNVADCLGKGWQLLRRVWSVGGFQAAVSSSHRSQPAKQRTEQSHHDVQFVPQHSPQIESAACWIDDICAGSNGAEPIPVYDIQVEGNSNFFAGGVLVHNCLLWDDPHGANQIDSDIQREEVLEQFDQGWSSRRNDLENSPIVIVMQRLHHMDITGHLMKQGGWTLLAIPMRYDPEITYDPAKDLGRPDLKDPRIKPGELMFPAKFSEKAVKELELRLGSYGAAGQLQQRPSPKGGGTIKTDQIRLWPNNKPLPVMQFVLQSYDTAYTKDTTNDPTACTVWGIFWHEGRNNAMMIDCWQEHMEYPDLRKRVVKEWKTKYAGDPKDPANKARHPNLALIEKKGSGQSLLQDLAGTGIQLAEYNPGLADKTARAHLITPVIEAGMVWVREGKAGDCWPSWAVWLENQLKRFPNDEHDDGVDTCTQALRYLKDSGFLVMMVSLRDEDYPQPPPKEYKNVYTQ